MTNHGFGSGWFGGGAGGGPFGMGGVPGAGGFGTGGAGIGGMGAGDLDALARQYWSAWGEQLRAAGAPAPPAAPGWDEAIGWWSQLARGGRSESNDMLERFNSQARGWFAQMQQLSGQFSGQDNSAADVARAWKQSLGDNPFANVLQGMQGPGQQGIEQWFQQVAPLLQSLQQGGQGVLGLPTFGIAREHQQRWQQLAQAQAEQQEHSKAYQALLAEAGKQAFDRFEDKLAEHSEPGRQLGTARALFDLWIDAAEEAYAEIALSPKFREVYGKHANAEMRLRAAIQREIEESCGLFGIPGRTEVDGAHRKIAQLERELRRLRDAVEHGAVATAVAPSPVASKAKAPTAARAPASASASAAPSPAAKPVERKSAKAKPAAAQKVGSKKVAVNKVAAKKVAAKKVVANQAAARAAPASPRAQASSVRRKPAAKPLKRAATRAPASKRAPTATAKRKR